MKNPLLGQWRTPFDTPPFHLIEKVHFKVAVEDAIKTASDEVNSIAGNPGPPSFENSIAALDRSGEVLGRITSLLFNLNSAETSKELQTIAQEISPLLTRFSNDITMNEKLFARIKVVYDSKDSLPFTTEQKSLTEKKFRNFILGGAGLNEEGKARFREISEELSGLGLKFEENVLDETNAFELNITDHDDLEGLPGSIIEMASAEAVKRGKKGWVFTLNFPSYMPFMQYSARRALREKMLRAYNSRCFNGDAKDNRSLITRIVNLRLEEARLLGFGNYAGMVLGDRMADTVDKVTTFLKELHEASHNAGLRDFQNVKEFACAKGHKGDIERWDWAYYSEKLKKEKYDIDDELLRSFFSLENVQNAVFDLAGKLFGISFEKNEKIPVYHNEVRTWEVYDRDKKLLAILYLDYHPRPGKNGGAWMTSFRDQRIKRSNDIRPLISIVTNFTRPTASRPSLLTFTELTTFLHEFGHALHGMFSRCTYESLAGTNVARDFVELPSQLMENWAFENEWLDTWAVHYLTGEKIPHEIVRKIQDASTFNEGYACQRQLSFGFLDMAWHTIEDPFESDTTQFESIAIAGTDPFPKIDNTCISTSFTHIFGGGYAAGYYGYKWAEVLDADAFRYFREKGIFSGETAGSFRENILEKGGTDKPMNLYKKFRGKEPSIEAFLERSGLKT